MSRLSVVRFKEMEKIRLALGFEIVRQKGSHVFYRHLTAEPLRFQITREET